MYLKLHRFSELIDRYNSLLELISQTTRNESSEAINSILDALNFHASAFQDLTILSKMYELTLDALKLSNNERLWFSTNLRLARTYLEGGKLDKADEIISVLKKSCLLPDGSEDISKKGNLLLDVYCLEIQLCSITGDTLRMNKIYSRTLNLNSAVADPRVMAIIREEGGRMFMKDGKWDLAYNELYEAFRHYQESGNSKAKLCLKYVVLASILALSNINPFAAREAMVYKDDREIIALRELRSSLESNNLERFESILMNKENRMMDDPFAMTYVEPLRRRMREQVSMISTLCYVLLIFQLQVLVNLIKPYKAIKLSFVENELHQTREEVESLFIDLIMNDKLHGWVDTIEGYFFSDKESTFSSATSVITATWANALVQASKMSSI